MAEEALSQSGLTSALHHFQSLVAAVVAWLIATTAAQAQYVVENKGRPFSCVLFDTGCTVPPLLGAPLQPLPDQRRRPAPGASLWTMRCIDMLYAEY